MIWLGSVVGVVCFCALYICDFVSLLIVFFFFWDVFLGLALCFVFF